jgi:beta-glucosidase
VELAPGWSRTLSMPIDPRLLAGWTDKGWAIAGGRYQISIGRSAFDLDPAANVVLPARIVAR